MPPEENSPNVKLPGVEALAGFLDDAEPVVETIEEPEDDGGLLKDVETEPLPEGDSFDRKYVEKLRRESASYRERAKKYESVFEGYEDGAVDEWRTLIEGFKSDPKSVAEQMKQLSEQILESFTPAEQEEIKEALTDDEQPLTMKQLQTILDQRQNDQEMEGLVRDIESEATTLGYNIKSREYKILLMTAQELPSGSIAEAHALLESERQHEFDRRIVELEKAGGGYRNPSTKVGVPSNEKDIKSFADAKEALLNFMDANK